MSINIFVGYDMREHAAWMVCRESLLNPLFGSAAKGINVIPLSTAELRRNGDFDRTWRTDEVGQMWDERDQRPFSTAFSHSRFLVPFLAKQQGLKGPVMFVDCDFMFLRPVTELFDALNPNKVVSVVKHDFNAVQEGHKMDGVLQQRYFRKLWSSLMVFNMDHPDIDLFTSKHGPNHSPGSTLHGFLALEDHEIGEIDQSWNFIPGHSLDNGDPNAIHWSFGGPWMTGYENTPYSHVWRETYRRLAEEALKTNLTDLFPLV